MLTESKFSRTMMRQRHLIRSKKSEGESKGWERAADGQKDVNPPRSPGRRQMITRDIDVTLGPLHVTEMEWESLRELY